MLVSKKNFQFMFPCSCLSLLVVTGLGGGIERFVPIGCNLDREVRAVKKVILAQESEGESSDPDCLKRGCQPPRFVS